MASAKDTLTSLKDKLSLRKHHGSEKHSDDNDQLRGRSEDQLLRQIEDDEVLSSDDSDRGDFTSVIDAKPLDDFLDASDAPEIRRRYGRLDLIMSQSAEEPASFTRLSQLSVDLVGQPVTFRARVHIIRRMGPSLVFIILRDQLTTVQAVLRQRENEVSDSMVRWAEHIRSGTVVIVKGKIQQAEQAVKTTTFHDIELLLDEVHVVSERLHSIPFNVYEAEAATDGHSIADHVRLSNRILDLRTPTSQAIFRLQSGVCTLFRSFLCDQGFLEIHTPKLQGGATEGGSEVFKLDYFGRTAFLAQSPQLAKQMCISADFRRVCEVGPVFRAENSNTARHMTEYTGLDLEMEINWHYHEAMWLIDAVLKHIFQSIYKDYRNEIETMKHHFPHEDLVWLEQTPRLTFAEGAKMLNDAGWRNDDGSPQTEDKDLPTKAEKRLGELVKEQYYTDYYILDKFPTSARPFYTMLDPNDAGLTNSFDFMVRGQEILTGGQRVHDVELLLKRMRESEVDPTTLREYVEAFEWVAPPHAGAGIGLERLLMLLFDLGNIRYATLFPRDPRSFPADPSASRLRHPQDSTLPPQRRKGYLQPLENLVANFGDSTNTSWFDKRFQIWRDTATGAAVAYVPMHKRAILPGNPLCATQQLPDVIAAFLKWLKAETELKPIFILVDKAVENVLGDHFGWKSFTNVAEQRVNLAAQEHLELDGDVQRKIRHAQRDGVKVTNYGSDVPDGIRARCDERIKAWQESRSGEQVHLSDVNPWTDAAHRQYFVAESQGKSDGDGEGSGNGDGNDPKKEVTTTITHALVVLAQLAPRYGAQVKWAIDFPSASNGAIELTVQSALKAAAETNSSCTFGAGVSADLASGHNIGTAKATSLNTVYHAYAERFHVREKAGFREKFNASEDPLYFCYPRKAMGRNGIRAIVDFFRE